MNKKILLFSRDPGGANVIAPLYNPLQTKGYQVDLLGLKYSLQQYKNFNIRGINLHSLLPSIDENKVHIFLKYHNYTDIITATSSDDHTEQLLWSVAKKLNIKTYAILDQWINYKPRFWHPHTNKMIFPDFIFVMDEKAKTGILNYNFPEKNIIVSGTPYFSYLRQKILTKNLTPHKKSFQLVFASEPLSEVYEYLTGKSDYWGYTEKTIFKKLVQTLNKFTSIYKKSLTILVKQHPKENPLKYKKIINESVNELTHDNKYISFSVKREASSLEIISKSDLVCGMSSMLLLESILLNKPTLSIQIDLKKPDPWQLPPSITLQKILTSQELYNSLKKIIIDKKMPNQGFSHPKNAILSIINFIENQAEIAKKYSPRRGTQTR